MDESCVGPPSGPAFNLNPNPEQGPECHGRGHSSNVLDERVTFTSFTTTRTTACFLTIFDATYQSRGGWIAGETGRIALSMVGVTVRGYCAYLVSHMARLSSESNANGYLVISGWR